MKVLFKPSFIKDFHDLPAEIRKEIRKICLEIFPQSQSINKVEGYKIKPMKGFKDYYRLRLGDYRIGFKKENNSVIFMRVKHRKDIYKYFP